jgi:hypothetical protein
VASSGAHPDVERWFTSQLYTPSRFVAPTIEVADVPGTPPPARMQEHGPGMQNHPG